MESLQDVLTRLSASGGEVRVTLSKDEKGKVKSFFVSSLDNEGETVRFAFNGSEVFNATVGKPL